MGGVLPKIYNGPPIESGKIGEDVHVALLLNHTRPQGLNVGGGALPGETPVAKNIFPMLVRTRASFPQPWPNK